MVLLVLLLGVGSGVAVIMLLVFKLAGEYSDSAYA